MSRKAQRQSAKPKSGIPLGAYIKQGRAAYNNGDITSALNIFAKGVKDHPQEHDLKVYLVRCLAQVEFKSFNMAAKKMVLTCLKEEGLNHQDLSKTWYSLLLCDPVFKPLQNIIDGKPHSPNGLKSCIKETYLIEGLSKLIIYDMRFEKALVRIAGETHIPAFEKAYKAYCENTESVFLETPEDPVSYSVDSSIQSLGLSRDDISEKVRGHYEENPYPRWRCVHVYNTPLKPSGEFCEHLVAGCGTGFGLCSTALMKPHATITAIDISKASLSYAKGKAQELGLRNITFYHADILNLKELDQEFDIIECSGVLHHMDEVKAGWAALLEKLKPQGKMNIGLYSKTARNDINCARDIIAKSGLKAVHSDIKKAREMIFDLPKDNPARSVLKRHDFYSTSGCRDLLFHEQEIQMTLPEIENILGDLNLGFEGFNTLPANIIQKYKALFSDDPKCLNLQNWHMFELDNPDTFKGMYQFWCTRK